MTHATRAENGAMTSTSTTKEKFLAKQIRSEQSTRVTAPVLARARARILAVGALHEASPTMKKGSIIRTIRTRRGADGGDLAPDAIAAIAIAIGIVMEENLAENRAKSIADARNVVAAGPKAGVAAEVAITAPDVM
jgi:hypothetical protein